MKIKATLIGLLIFAILILVSSVYGQNHNNHWYFGNQQAIDFSSGKPVVLNNSQMLSLEANASFSDPSTGELLLYTNGQQIWNRKHEIMENGDHLWGHQSATQGTMMICPMPSSPNKLYVFHIDRNGSARNHNGALNYSIVDMNLDGGLGAVVEGEKNIELMAESTEKVSVIRHENGCGLWVIGHLRNSDEYRAHLLTDRGILDTIISTIGSIHRADSTTATIGEMAVSMDGKKLAVIVHQKNIIELFDFDRQSGQLTNPLKLAGQFHDYGIAFSPNGKLLYVSNFAAESHLRQYHISDWNQEQADTTMIVIGSCESDELKFGGLQMGPDGILYLKRSTAEEFPDSLAAVIYPDRQGVACGFVKNYLYLPLNHGAHAYGPELNFSNLMNTNALPFESDCFRTGSREGRKSDEFITNRRKRR